MSGGRPACRGSGRLLLKDLLCLWPQTGLGRLCKDLPCLWPQICADQVEVSRYDEIDLATPSRRHFDSC